MIGDGIEVQVLRTGRDGVRLGIVAPATVPIHRREVYTQIRDANQAAATPPADLGGIVRRLNRHT